MEDGAVLPMRFGSIVADDAELRAILFERRREFEAGLDRVRGAVELSVRAQIRAAEAQPAASATATSAASGPGTAYLLGRLETERRDDDVAARIHEPLAMLARESTRRQSGVRPGAFAAAYLVERARV